MDNGTVQLRVGSEAVRELFQGIGVTNARAHLKRVPEAIFTAPVDVQAAFLRGLFGADGCVSRVESDGKANRYVGLGSRSERLLAGRSATAVGVRNPWAHLSKRASRDTVVSRTFALTVRPSSTNRARALIYASPGATSTGSPTPSASQRHARTRRWQACWAKPAGIGPSRHTELIAREYDGQEHVYNLTEPLHHSYIVEGFVVSNCSEYMHVDDSACNLASLNLMKFRRADGTFDVESFDARGRHHVPRTGDHRLSVELPDRADREQRPGLPPAWSRLRQSRCLPDGGRRGV